jgi:hypothetical protein
MSKVKEGLVRGAFVLGVAGALVFGGQAAFAAGRVADCLCDPDDPLRHEFCGLLRGSREPLSLRRRRLEGVRLRLRRPLAPQRRVPGGSKASGDVTGCPEVTEPCRALERSRSRSR